MDEIAAQALDGVVAFEPARNPLEVEDTVWQERVCLQFDVFAFVLFHDRSLV